MHPGPVLLALPVALALAACSGSPSDTTGAGPSPQSATPSLPASPSTPVTTPDVATPAAASASPTGSPARASAGASATSPAAVVAGPPRCLTSQLSLAVGSGQAAAGTSYTPLVLRNTGPAACHLTGFPGVSFLDAGGRQVGRAASMDQLAAQTVLLAPGRTGYALLATANAGAYDPARCRATAAARVRVYPPGDRVALTAPFPVEVCADTSVRQSRVDPVRTGSGPDAG